MAVDTFVGFAALRRVGRWLRTSLPTNVRYCCAGRRQANVPTPNAIALASPRSYDGTGNNLQNPQWGSTDEQLLRVAENDYPTASLPWPAKIVRADERSAMRFAHSIPIPIRATAAYRRLCTCGDSFLTMIST